MTRAFLDVELTLAELLHVALERVSPWAAPSSPRVRVALEGPELVLDRAARGAPRAQASAAGPQTSPSTANTCRTYETM